jgi:acyl-CoA thioesterase-2
MGQVLDSLVTLLALERIEENLFRGQSQDLGWGTVFGGQVLGQALSAAVQTAPADRDVHSLHAYFLRPGDVSKPIVYDVDRIRDGGSFTTRRVVAIQSGQAIFNMAASFHKAEDGYEHQDAMPDVPPPESVPTEQERFKQAVAAKLAPAQFVERFTREQPFEMRPVEVIDHPIHPTPMPPRRLVWLKTTGRLPDNPALHCYLLAARHEIGERVLKRAARVHSIELLRLVLGNFQHLHSKNTKAVFFELFDNVAHRVFGDGIRFHDSKSALQCLHKVVGRLSLVVR